MARIFSFPDPVNDTTARVVAGGVVGMAAASAAGAQPWLMIPLVYGFAARVATGPTLSPLGQIATRWVSPRIPAEPTFSPGPPKRFAQSLGLLMSSTALVLHYGFGKRRASQGCLAALIFAASLEAFFGICLGCKIFALAIRVGLVPESVCEECNTISVRATALTPPDAERPPGAGGTLRAGSN